MIRAIRRLFERIRGWLPGPRDQWWIVAPNLSMCRQWCEDAGVEERDYRYMASPDQLMGLRVDATHHLVVLGYPKSGSTERWQMAVRGARGL